jgi:hypothetical protein
MNDWKEFAEKLGRSYSDVLSPITHQIKMRILIILLSTSMFSLLGFAFANNEGSNNEDSQTKSYIYEITPEIYEKLVASAKKQGLKDKDEIEKTIKKVEGILATKNMFIVKRLEAPCSHEISTHCREIINGHSLLDCLKYHRDQSKEYCEEAMKREFGGKPLKKDQIYRGVVIPKGSIIQYDFTGVIVGAETSQNFVNNNIVFQKGQIQFNKTGLRSGQLANDQYVDGIKYKACNIGPFFHENGVVENAILAENTIIGDYSYKADSQVLFYPNGQVQQGTLAQAAIINGESILPDTTVWFDEKGSLTEKYPAQSH